MNFKNFLNEMAHISKFNSGWLKSNEARSLVKAFREGAVTAEVGNKSYKATKKISGSALKKGQVVFASYSKVNQGANIYEILGFTGAEEKYGDGGVKFDSVKELLAHYKVSNLKELEEKQSENGHGYGSYIVIKDLKDGDEGAYFYLYNGSWVRGSGAEKLTFIEIEEV